MRRFLTGLTVALLLAGCNKDEGDTEQLAFVCSGGSGSYQMVYTDPESGKLHYSNDKQVNLSLKPGKTVKVTASDRNRNWSVNLTLKVNGNKVKEDVQMAAAIEYTNVQ